MIGQKNLINKINSISIDKFPRFLVLVGDKGSGKTTLSHLIADNLKAEFALSGIKVDEIREVINTAYNVRDKVVYCIKDADTMRNEAKNAMLKITEEPPKNAYFIMTVQDDSSLLDTIKSRAFVLYMEPYTIDDLKEYYHTNYTAADSDIDIVCDIATTPYEIDKLIEYGGDFIEYVSLVVDNIAEVEPANAFKSSDKLALKKEEGYDLKLFFKVFCKVCMDKLEIDLEHYAHGVVATVDYINKCGRLGVNKQQLYDSWVFDIREVWL